MDVGKNKMAAKKKKMKEQMYKKHMGNKQEGQGFAQARKEKMMREYQKMLRKERKQQGAIGGKQGDVVAKKAHIPSSSQKQKVKVTAFYKAEKQFEKKSTEMQKTREEKEKISKERLAALGKYKQKKKKTLKMLSKRNYKGQPNMASQMELLIEKIQQQKKKS